jgi:hypothetical protein
MNSELAYIHSQCHGQELSRAAQREQRFDAAASRNRGSRPGRMILNLRISRGWRALTIRRAAVGKA